MMPDDKPERRYPLIEAGSLDPSEILFGVYWWLFPPGGVGGWVGGFEATGMLRLLLMFIWCR